MKHSAIAVLREMALLAIANRLPCIPALDRVRLRAYKLAGLKVSGRCLIWGPMTIRPVGGGQNIEIGEGTFVNAEVRFAVPVDKVVIGRNVHVGPRVMFETVNHELRHVPGLGRRAWTKRIVVEDEAWIGAGAIITQGVTIGRGAVVAAGAVVVESVAANTLVGGVPAKVLKAELGEPRGN